MSFYTAYAPAGTHVRDVRAAEKVVFLRDGFSWGALVFSFLWLAWNRAFTPALIVFAVTAALAAAGALFPAAEDTFVAISLLFAVFVGLEAENWVAWSLERKGYQPIGLADGDSRAECERRIFSEWAAAPGPEPRPAPPPARPGIVPAIVGLFPGRGQ